MESSGLVFNTGFMFILQTNQKLYIYYIYLYYVVYIITFYVFDLPQMSVCVRVMYFLAS